MQTNAAKIEVPVGDVEADELARADLYALLGSLFFAAPDARLLAMVATSPGADGDGNASEFGAAWRALREAAAAADAQRVQDEYTALFLSIGRPRVYLFGSYYLAGFLNEAPLVELRDHLGTLGLARRGAAGETEDHISALCDVMRLLIVQASAGAPAERQKAFFSRHLAPWYARMTASIEACAEADFYRHVARVAKAFFDVESVLFEMSNQ